MGSNNDYVLIKREDWDGLWAGQPEDAPIKVIHGRIMCCRRVDEDLAYLFMSAD